MRPINQIVIAETPVVPDPHTLLSNIPENTQWYTVIDLCSAFFSIPLHPDSRHLFAFTYGGQQYTYTRLPQGYCESPSVFNQVLARDLQNLQQKSRLLQYVDDLLICSETREQCLKDSITVLKALAENGHKVSKEKLQFCSKKVEYLGRVLEGTTRKISPTHVEAIRNAPRPENVRQMLSFLGMAGFSRPWICDFALKAQPLRDMIKAAGQNKPSAKLEWTSDGIAAFELIKNTMASAPALACPNYSKPFHLYVSERQGFASAVLMQHQEGMGNQPIAYFSTAVSGKRYILVVVDRFSRWVEAIATADNKAKTVAKFLCREVIPRFGIPDQIQSDNGSHFTNELMKTVWKALGVKQKLGCVYHPQSQGMVERANGTIKAKVAKICASTKLNWVQALPLALMKMRSQTNRTLHLTPHEIVTGCPMPMPYTR
ncbi:hypothetical protein HF521_006913, partial [Silurus meridionalis]